MYVYQIEICSLCGLFGGHHGHKIVQIRELQTLSKKLTEKLNSERKKMIYWKELKSKDLFIDLLKDKVKGSGCSFHACDAPNTLLIDPSSSSIIFNVFLISRYRVLVIAVAGAGAVVHRGQPLF